MTEPLICVRNLCVDYPRAQVVKMSPLRDKSAWHWSGNPVPANP